MEILGYIKVYFTEQEKEILRQTAKEQQLSLSQLVKIQCKNIFNPTYQILPSLLDAKEHTKHNSNKFIKVYLSEKEHEKLQLAAKEKGIGMSRLIFEALITKPIPIEIKYETTDIYDLIIMMTDTYKHLIGTAEGLWRRNLIFERDKERLLTLGYEIRDLLKKYVDLTYRNRNAIRKTAVRHLDKRIEKIIAEQIDSVKKSL